MSSSLVSLPQQPSPSRCFSWTSFLSSPPGCRLVTEFDSHEVLCGRTKAISPKLLAAFQLVVSVMLNPAKRTHSPAVAIIGFSFFISAGIQIEHLFQFIATSNSPFLDLQYIKNSVVQQFACVLLPLRTILIDVMFFAS